MIIRICAFTDKGMQLASQIEELLSEDIIEIYNRAQNNLNAWIEEAFAIRIPLIFVGACGIAVRKISPYVNDKLQDTPVVVIDEKGAYVIPILSGHVGGGNSLAGRIAELIGATEVITTATDINECLSIDTWAGDNRLGIYNRDGIAYISSEILKGNSISYAVEDNADCYDELSKKWNMTKVSYSSIGKADIIISKDIKMLQQCKLFLFPKKICIGIGCKKGTEWETISAKVKNVLINLPIPIKEVDICKQIAGIASIDIKSKEYGLNAFTQKLGASLTTYSADELLAVEGAFSESEFVESVTGVSNVCERAAVLLAGEGASLIMPKQSGDGVTVAVALMR